MHPQNIMNFLIWYMTLKCGTKKATIESSNLPTYNYVTISDI